MLSRRRFLALSATVAATACAKASPDAAPLSAKRLIQAVTLVIAGMTWAGCVEPVRSALAAVKGVSQATVSFERHEADVEYDSGQCSLADLVAAVARIKDPTMPTTFSAMVKRVER
jgi:copper chaperone CopZ